MNKYHHKPCCQYQRSGPRRGLLPWLLACLCLLPVAAHAQNDVEAAARPVPVILSDQSGPYASFRQGFASALPEALSDRVSYHEMTDSEWINDLPDTDLIITVGMSATRKALDSGEQAILAAMIPADSFRRLQQRYPDRALNALLIDQPPQRHAALVRVILPEADTLMVLSGNQDPAELGNLDDRAERLNLVIRHQATPDRASVIQAIRDTAAQVDAFLLLPSRVNMDAPTLRALLLHSFRAGLPSFGYSPGLVSAGAIAAVHSDPEELGKETAQWLQTLLEHEGPWQVSRYPLHFKVSGNRDVARSLGITVPSTDVIRHRIQALEADDAS